MIPHIFTHQFRKRTGEIFSRAFLVSIALLTLSDWIACQEPAAPTAKDDKSAVVETAGRIKVSDLQLEKAGIRMARPTKAKFAVDIKLTGRVALNEDRLAHIFPIVNGQVESVKVGLGDSVSEGDPLVTVHSREVGNAKLDLFQARLALELAQLKLKQQQEISDNTIELLQALKTQDSIAGIQDKMTGRAMGDYRDKLISSYTSYLKSNADVDRLSDVVNSGAVSSKQFAWAKSTRDADQAAFLSKMEQVDYELKTSLLQATQLVRKLKRK